MFHLLKKAVCINYLLSTLCVMDYVNPSDDFETYITDDFSSTENEPLIQLNVLDLPFSDKV